MIWLFGVIGIAAIVFALYVAWCVAGRLCEQDDMFEAYDSELTALLKRVSELELNQERPANHGAMKAPAKKRTARAK